MHLYSVDTQIAGTERTDTPSDLLGATTLPTRMETSDATNDWDLVRQCRIDPAVHFSVLVKRHYNLVANLCYKFFLDKEHARDATHDIFLQVYRSLDRVEERGLPFVHWLCRVATNHCRNVYRRNRREQRLLEERRLDLDGDDSFLSEPADWTLERREAADSVHRALKKIKPDERMTLVMSEMLSLDVKEIAVITGVQEHKVRRRIRNAKERMKKIIAQERVIGNAKTDL